MLCFSPPFCLKDGSDRFGVMRVQERRFVGLVWNSLKMCLTALLCGAIDFSHGVILGISRILTQ